ncbi:MAG: metalloregulator ArsR/SmtB family transcription factor [Anaerolineae bacterium]
MTELTSTDELLDFFKALADANRLKIVGLLAQQSYTVEQLAAMLELGASTVSHHLSMLSHVGLVSAKAEQYYNVYSLNLAAIQSMAQRLLAREELPKLADEVDRTAYDRKVMAAFVRSDGTIRSFPAQEKKFQVLLRYVLDAFEPGQRYTEKQVNNRLAKYSDDTAALRRGLIEYKLMAREAAAGGSTYWRIDQS